MKKRKPTESKAASTSVMGLVRRIDLARAMLNASVERQRSRNDGGFPDSFVSLRAKWSLSRQIPSTCSGHAGAGKLESMLEPQAHDVRTRR